MSVRVLTDEEYAALPDDAIVAGAVSADDPRPRTDPTGNPPTVIGFARSCPERGSRWWRELAPFVLLAPVDPATGTTDAAPTAAEPEPVSDDAERLRFVLDTLSGRNRP